MRPGALPVGCSPAVSLSSLYYRTEGTDERRLTLPPPWVTRAGLGGVDNLAGLSDFPADAALGRSVVVLGLMASKICPLLDLPLICLVASVDLDSLIWLGRSEDGTAPDNPGSCNYYLP